MVDLEVCEAHLEIRGCPSAREIITSLPRHFTLA
jgi:hypothetical protein